MSTALTTYKALQLASLVGGFNPKYYKGAAKAVRYGRQAAQAIKKARQIAKAVSGMKRKRPRNPYAKTTKRARRIESAKTRQIVNRRWNLTSSAISFANLARNSLAAEPIRFVEPPDTNDGPREAPGMRYMLTGFKQCYTFRNVSTLPLHVHMAIVQPKQEKITITDLKKDFYTSPGNDDRYQDFYESFLWNRDADCSNLNPRKFNILTHQRFILNPRDSNDSREFGSTWKHWEKWYGINKRFEYESPTSTDTMKPIWIMVWYETIFPTTVATDLLQYNIVTTAYVKPNKI